MLDQLLANRAHPRSRGEHTCGFSLFGGGVGSSPLTRGAPAHRRLIRSTRRLIPAHAGSTRVEMTPWKYKAAHPRSRGEHHASLACNGEFNGSSPLTRGALVDVLLEGGRSAHPRSRGEHPSCSVMGGCSPGSSPLTRGALQHRVQRSAHERLIPAHAGSTETACSRKSQLAAHPRSRGEHKRVLDIGETRVGSSPLTRGALELAGYEPVNPGLIPAHAGSTLVVLFNDLNVEAHPRSRGEHARCFVQRFEC